MPVPIMFAITMHVAVSGEMRWGVIGVDINYSAIISHAVAATLRCNRWRLRRPGSADYNARNSSTLREWQQRRTYFQYRCKNALISNEASKTLRGGADSPCTTNR